VLCLLQELMGKRDMLKELEEQLDFLDEDDDGLVDENELKAFLSANKDAAALFQVEDAAVLVKMFDKDGSGKLDVEEMYSLRQFLADKKAKVDEAIVSATHGDRWPDYSIIKSVIKTECLQVSAGVADARRCSR
jgi:Ca2+-binding EF-hand superfamily protein